MFLQQNVFQKVKTAFQTVSNAESEEEVVNYDGHIKEAKEFGTKELECEGLKAMVPEGVQQVLLIIL